MNTWILVGRLGEVDLIERVERLKPFLDEGFNTYF